MFDAISNMPGILPPAPRKWARGRWRRRKPENRMRRQRKLIQQGNRDTNHRLRRHQQHMTSGKKIAKALRRQAKARA